MKFILIFFIGFTTPSLFAQVQLEQLSGMKIADRKRYLATDTIPKVIYLESKENSMDIAWILNEEVIPEQAMKTIDTQKIGALTVDKVGFEKDGKEYEGVIHISTKDGYEPRFVTLNELKKQYTKSSNLPTVFLFNDEVINSDYDEYLVDEKFILKIEVEIMENAKEELNLQFIKIITRTEENLKKANTIILRGKQADS